MIPSSLSLQDIAAFVAVAQNASFTRAAEQLGTAKSNIGKSVRRLEAALETRLLHRTTRAVRLTEEGQAYLDAARTALAGLAEAEMVLAARREEPAGRVRLDISVGLAPAIVPTLADLRRKHPKVTLELSLTDRYSDPVRDGWDIVVRVGDLPASGDMVVRKLCELRNGLYAAPGYLDRRPPILLLQDLHDQDGVVYRTNAGQLRPWLIMVDGAAIEFLPRATIIAHDGRTVIDTVKAGLGIGQIFDRVAAPFVAAGELVPVLPALSVSARPVYALIPGGRTMPPKTRVVLEHLSSVLRSLG